VLFSILPTTERRLYLAAFGPAPMSSKLVVRAPIENLFALVISFTGRSSSLAKNGALTGRNLGDES
jgi:hypothetical protein